MHKVSDKVYVIGNPGVGTVKIGIAVDVERRLAEIANGFHPWVIDPARLEVLRVYRSLQARNIETVLHAAFSAERVRIPGFISSSRRSTEGTTEWFRLGPTALARVGFQVTRWADRWKVEVV